MKDFWNARFIRHRSSSLEYNCTSFMNNINPGSITVNFLVLLGIVIAVPECW